MAILSWSRRPVGLRAAAGRPAAPARLGLHRHGQQPDLLRARLGVHPRLLQPGRGDAEPARGHGAGGRLGAHQADAVGLDARPGLVAYPVLVARAIVVTGNHYVLDIAGGLAVVLPAAALAAWIVRARPEVAASRRRRPRTAGAAPGRDIRPVDRGGRRDHDGVTGHRPRPAPGGVPRDRPRRASRGPGTPGRGSAGRAGGAGAPLPGAPDAGAVARLAHRDRLLRRSPSRRSSCSSRRCTCAPATRSTARSPSAGRRRCWSLFAVGVVSGTILSLRARAAVARVHGARSATSSGSASRSRASRSSSRRSSSRSTSTAGTASRRRSTS